MYDRNMRGIMSRGLRYAIITALVLLAVIALPAGAFADSGRYDTREQSWYSGIRVRDQSPTGLCWAFASTTAAEISWAKETSGKARELSPAHLGYFMYNREDDPLGNTAGDKNTVLVTDWASLGAEPSHAMQHLATWSGAGAEENTPFSAVVENMVEDPETYEFHIDPDFAFDSKYAYDDCLILENSVYHDSASRETLKEMIHEYGAVVSAVNLNPNYFENGYWTGTSYYDPVQTDPGTHAVTVIGWDDAYPKERFSSRSGGEAELRPENDGAWIVQDSYGTEYFHEDGFFYVSYESAGIIGQPAVAYDMQPADVYEYNYQYDGSVYPGYTGEAGQPQAGAGSKAANVFTAKRDIDLKAVGITEYSTGQIDYTVRVYTDLTDENDAESGRFSAETEYHADTAGCKTIKLPEAVRINEGQLYSIVVIFGNDAARFGVERSDKSDYLEFTADTAPGQSFFKAATSQAWEDMSTEYSSCFRIKGFADSAGPCEHEWSEWKTVTAATEQAEGISMRTCRLCGAEETKSIPKLAPAKKSEDGTGKDETAKDKTAGSKTDTGDGADLPVWISLMLASLLGLSTVVNIRRVQRQR